MKYLENVLVVLIFICISTIWCCLYYSVWDSHFMSIEGKIAITALLSIVPLGILASVVSKNIDKKKIKK